MPFSVQFLAQCSMAGRSRCQGNLRPALRFYPSRRCRKTQVFTEFDDPAVYELIARGDTIGVFQVESRAQAQILPRLRPRRFADLADFCRRTRLPRRVK